MLAECRPGSLWCCLCCAIFQNSQIVAAARLTRTRAQAATIAHIIDSNSIRLNRLSAWLNVVSLILLGSLAYTAATCSSIASSQHIQGTHTVQTTAARQAHTTVSLIAYSALLPHAALRLATRAPQFFEVLANSVPDPSVAFPAAPWEDDSAEAT